MINLRIFGLRVKLPGYIAASAILVLVTLVLASCDGTGAGSINRVLSNDDMPADNALVTDDRFAPQVVSIKPHDFCALNPNGVSTNCNNDIADKIVFGNGGVRFVIEFDKPVHYNEATVGDLEFINANYLNLTVENSSFVPIDYVESLDAAGKTIRTLRIVDNPNPTGSYTFFTTPNRQGYIKALADGNFTIKVPQGVMYANNPSDKKVYNKEGEATYIFDSTPPTAELRFTVSEMNSPTKLMSPSANDDNGVSKDFSDFGVLIDWKESVNPTGNIADMLLLGDVLEIRCSGCSSQPYNQGMGSSGSGSGVTYLGTNNEKSIYRFNIKDDDISGDKLSKLLAASAVNFIVKSGSFGDLAGNQNNVDYTHRVSVDSLPPAIKSIEMISVGASTPSGSVNNNQSVLGVGDYIEFTVNYSEDIRIDDSSLYKLGFSVGNLALEAELLDTEKEIANQYKDSWVFRYTVPDSVGDNKINSTLRADNTLDIPGNQFSGSQAANESSTADTTWHSDFGIAFSILSEAAVDRVGLPHPEFNEQLLNNSTLFPTNGLIINTHVDGSRPYIVTDEIEDYTLLLSGDPSTDIGTITRTVSNGGKLAIAIPFSEPIRNSEETDGMMFNNEGLGTLSINYCSNIATSINDCVVAHSSDSATFDQVLTAAARSISQLGRYQYRTAVYSVEINGTYTDIRSIVVNNYEIPGVAISEYTDLARNTFRENEITDTGFVLNKAVVITVEGSGFGISRIQLVDPDASGDEYTNADIAEDTRRNYNLSNSTFHVEVSTTQPLNTTSLSGVDGILVLSVRTPDGTITDVSSDSLNFIKDTKNRLLFTFDLLSALPLEDYNGIEIKELVVVDPSKFVDKSNQLIDPSFTSSQVSDSFRDSINIDTHAPSCTTARFTTNSNGTAAASDTLYFGTRLGGSYAQSIFFAIDCDQRLVLVPDPSDDSTRPYVPADFGGVSQQFAYANLSNNGARVVFRMPVQLGMQAGNGTLNAGIANSRSFNWHLENGTRRGDVSIDHRFFLDVAGNPLNLSSLNLTNGYLSQANLYTPDQTPVAGVVVNTRPYPITITYPLTSSFTGNYTYAGLTYISGVAPNNSFPFSINYGSYINAATQTTSLLAPESWNLAGNLIDENGNPIGTFAPVSVDGNQVNFAATINYGTLNSIGIDGLQTSFANYSPTGVPYTQAMLRSTNIHTGATSDISVDIPITKTLIDAAFATTLRNLPDLAKIRINNVQPRISAAGGTKVEMYYDGLNAGVSPVSLTDTNNPLNYGDIYFAMVFNKPMTETGMDDTYPDISIVNANGDTVAINRSALSFVKRAYLTHNDNDVFNTESTRVLVTDNKLFYKFAFSNSKYAAEQVIINNDGNSQVLLGLTSPIEAPTDIYGNVYFPEAMPGVNYTVDLVASSDVVDITFDKLHYRYGDTIRAKITTQRALNLSNITDAQETGLPVVVARDENGDSSSDSPQLILRYDAGHSGNTNSVLWFAYALTGADNQFDSDTLSSLGIKPTGNIQRCARGGADSTCVTYQTTSQSGDPVALSISSFASTSTLNSIVSRFVAENTNSLLESGVASSLKYGSSYAASEILLASTRLKQGDTLYFEFTPLLQDEQIHLLSQAFTNTINAGTSPSAIQFTLYDANTQSRVSRTASYAGLDGTSRKLIYSYTVQGGDLVHPVDKSLNAIDYANANGTTQTKGDNLAMQFNPASIFSATTNGTIDGFTDSIYANPFFAQVFDATGNALTASLLLKDYELQIDSRARITAITSDTTGNFTEGDIIDFTLTFNTSITAATPAQITSLVHFGGSLVDYRANSKVGTATNNTQSLTFTITVPSGVAGAVHIAGVELNGTSIRTNGTNINANLDVPANNTLADVNVDNVQPKPVEARLVSPQGGYGVQGAAVLNQRLIIELKLDKAIVTTLHDGDIMLPLTLDTNNGSTLAIDVPLEDAETTTTSLRFALDVTRDLPDTVRDYFDTATSTGLQFGNANHSSLHFKTGVSVTDAVGNNLYTGLDQTSDSFVGSVADQLASFPVSIDTAQPYIVAINNLGTGRTCDLTSRPSSAPSGSANYKCAKQNEVVSMEVVFSEEVIFSNISATNYKVNFDRSGGVLSATPVTLDSSRVATSFDFDFRSGTGYVDEDNIIPAGLVITPGSRIADGVGNDVTDLAFTSLPDITPTLWLDTIRPHVVSSAFVPGKYKLDDTLNLVLQFNEPIEVANLADISIDVLFIDESGQDVNRTFVATDQTNDGRDLVFSYTFDVTTDFVNYVSAQYLSPLHLGSAATTIADPYGNNSVLSFDNGPVDSNVTAQLAYSAVITSVVVKKGSAIVPTDINIPTYFDVGDTLTIEVNYDVTVDITNYSTSNRPGIDFYLSNSGQDKTAWISNATGNGTIGKTLIFQYTVAASDEDRDGILIKSFNIKNVTSGQNTIAATGQAKAADIQVSRSFANDIVFINGDTGKDNILETVLIDAVAPPELTSVTLTGFTNFDTPQGSLTVELAKPAIVNRGDDIAKYKVLLVDAAVAGNTYGQALIPPVTDNMGNSIFVGNATDTTFDIQVARATFGANCVETFVRVHTIDANNNYSTAGVVSSEQTRVNGLASFYFNNTPPSLNTLSASGNASKVDFGNFAYFGYPKVETATATSNCPSSSVQFNISYTDDAGNTVHVVPGTYNASNPATHYANVAEYLNEVAVVEEPEPYRTYTTTFRAVDSAGLTANASYTWVAYTGDLPVWYDAADATTIEGGTTVTKWKNKGDGASVYRNASSQNILANTPADFDLQPRTGSTDNHYTNVAPQYNATSKEVVFQASATNRPNLSFDGDAATQDTQTSSNLRIRNDSASGDYTIYMVVTPGGFGLTSGQGISTAFASDDTNLTQIGWYMDSGNYITYGSDTLGNSNGLSQPTSKSFIGLYNRATYPGHVYTYNNRNLYPYNNPIPVKTGTRQILVYALTHNGSNKYSLCRYNAYRSIDAATCSSQYVIEFNRSEGIDKLYLGSVAQSTSGANSNVSLAGAPNSGMKINEFLFYAAGHTKNIREEIVAALSTKWEIPNAKESDFAISLPGLANRVPNQRVAGSITQDGVNLQCFAGAADNNSVEFIPVKIENKALLAGHKLHLLVEQTQAGNTAGAINYLQLINLAMPAKTSFYVDGTNKNDGSGGFNLTLDGSAIPAASVITPWKGLCLTEKNEFQFYAYVSESPITSSGVQSAAEFEAAHAANLLERRVQSTVKNYIPENGAYSLRRLWDYNGPLVRVRDRVTSAERDVGFLANGDLDVTAIADFAGGHDIHVSKWYDQSGYGNDLYRDHIDATKLPLIAPAGVVRTNSKGMPQMRFEGNSLLFAELSTPITGQSTAAFIVLQDYRSSVHWSGLLSGYTPSESIHDYVSINMVFFRRYNLSEIFMSHSAGFLAAGPPSIELINGNTPYQARQMTSIVADNEGAVYTDGTMGTDLGTDDPDRGARKFNFHKLIMGSRWTYSVPDSYADFDISEVLVYGSNKSAEREVIEEFQMDYWIRTP